MDRSWRGVLFDLDGTLADTVDLILKSFRHTMEAHLGQVPPDARFLETIGKPLPVQLRGFARDEAEWAAMRETYIAYQREAHDAMVRPFPRAAEVMGALRESGTRVAVVTSKGARIGERTLEVCSLREHVDFVVYGDQVERGKPHPEPVYRALSALGLEGTPEEVVFVGDSPHDLRAGRSAGVRTAAVAWGPLERAVLEAERPDYFLDEMDDVLRIAPALTAPGRRSRSRSARPDRGPCP